MNKCKFAINRFIEIHGDRYDYSEFEYIKSTVKSIIICKQHGQFLMTPDRHKRGQGCALCANLARNKNKIITEEKFIEYMNSIQNISLLEYNTYNTESKFECELHGVFTNIPKRVYHSKNGGCSKCAKDQCKKKLKHPKSKMVEKLNNVHNNRYKYNKLNVNTYQEIGIITCRIHGDFKQLISNHAQGNGCPKCAIEKSSKARRKHVGILINELRKANNDKYKYPIIHNEYTSEKSKITIICDIHGKYRQLISNHKKGIGCPKCGYQRISQYNKENPRGWSPKHWSDCASKSKHFDSFKVYVIKCISENEVFYKIGKTYTTVNKRFPNLYTLPYHFEIISEFKFSCAYECSNFEQEIKNKHRVFKYAPNIPFKGQHECFSNIYSIYKTIE